MKIIACLVVHLMTALMANGQEQATLSLKNDSSMARGAVSVAVIEAGTGDSVFIYNPDNVLVPASIQKIITTSAALELLGPDHTFTTQLGYSGTINNKGVLTGDIIIKGGGDPALGSVRFKGHYRNLASRFKEAVTGAGIKSVQGNVICDDSYFDYNPVPAGWLWEDIGNYYGAGVYGLSFSDNTALIHLNTTSELTTPLITGIDPGLLNIRYYNNLTASGTTDEGYVFSSPYGTYGWIEGSVPAGKVDFILSASIPDPPLLMAETVASELKSSGIKIAGEATTVRILGKSIVTDNSPLITIISPALSEIISALNHESINLYSEHLLKEIGKIKGGDGSFSAGLDEIYSFIRSTGTSTEGLRIIDGSGLSPVNRLNTMTFVNLLSWYYNNSENYDILKQSFPEPGSEGTLRYYFKDPVFAGRVFIKSGSMTGVQCYSGYLLSESGKILAICIMINNFTGSNQHIINYAEEIIRETILNN